MGVCFWWVRWLNVEALAFWSGLIWEIDSLEFHSQGPGSCATQ